jgi:hypothetical protein
MLAVIQIEVLTVISHSSTVELLGYLLSCLH